MNKNLFKKPETPNLSDPIAQRAFIEDTYSDQELIRKELEINQAQQSLLIKRLEMMQSFVLDLPSDDPHYSMLLTQIQMDRVELDELKLRSISLLNKTKAS